MTGIPRGHSIHTKRIKYRIVVLAILLLSVIIREVYLIKYPVPARDSFEYVHFFYEWEKTKTIPLDRAFPPIAMMLLQFPHRLFGVELIKGGILLNFILGLCIVYLVCRTTKLITKSNLCVLLVGGMAATNPSLVHYSCQFLRDNIYLFFCSLCIVKSTELCYRYKFVTLLEIAFFSSMAYLSRHEGIELFLIEITVLLFLKNVSVLKKARIIFLYCLLCAVCFGAVLLISGLDISYYSVIFERKYFYLLELNG